MRGGNKKRAQIWEFVGELYFLAPNVKEFLTQPTEHPNSVEAAVVVGVEDDFIATHPHVCLQTSINQGTKRFLIEIIRAAFVEKNQTSAFN